MLLNLHVKNLALIDEMEVDFTEGFNCLTGETGAGKSIIIGSIELALGGRVAKDFLREGFGESLVELVFSVGEKQADEIRSLGFSVEDDQVILSRKMAGTRSISKINGETVPVSRLREVSGILIDIHGQHEHQSLLLKKKQLEILDEFAKERLAEPKSRLGAAYEEYCSLKKELQESRQDEESRARELSFLEYEVTEIEEAALLPGEDEQLEELYQKLSHGRKIMEAVSEVHGLTGYEEEQAAGEAIGKALKLMQSVAVYDETLVGMRDQLATIDSLLNDFNRDLSEYMDEFSFSEETLSETEDRLNLINRLKAKHGKTIPVILEAKKEKEERVLKLQNYDAYVQKLERRLQVVEVEAQTLCEKISAIRAEEAEKMGRSIRAHLADLNFGDVRFEIALKRMEHFGAGGFDEAEYLIATNVGEAMKPLSKVASGGELSRVMLALKTVLADKDEVGTVIFDEIDTGISGRTAQRVSEKMALIGRSRQVLCITHLPQIASMADTHFLIEKSVVGGMTVTGIRRLTPEEEITELARMLGGVEITDKVLENAREIKQQAKQYLGKIC